MKKEKVFLGGARFYGGQVMRLESPIEKLGYQITTDPTDADFIFVNNAWYDDFILLKQQGKTNAKFIFNVLDMAPHLGNEFPLEKLRTQLQYADTITCISNTVQNDIKTRLSIHAEVIYNPVKPIVNELLNEEQRIIPALFVGRVNDAEKRCLIGARALKIRAYTQVLTVGGERPFYGGDWSGPVDDESLSKIYNRSKYLICPTRNAFLGLPILEAMGAGCIPVITNDLDIRQEFLPSSVFPEYDAVQPDEWSIASFILLLDSNETLRKEFRQRLINHYENEVKPRVSPDGVAQRLVKFFKK